MTAEHEGRLFIDGEFFYLSPDIPFGGYGISGVGREHGEDGFREYLQAKTIASPAGR